MMLDWDGYRQELLKRIGDLGRLSPATVRVIVNSATLEARRRV